MRFLLYFSPPLEISSPATPHPGPPLMPPPPRPPPGPPPSASWTFVGGSSKRNPPPRRICSLPPPSSSAYPGPSSPGSRQTFSSPDGVPDTRRLCAPPSPPLRTPGSRGWRPFRFCRASCVGALCSIGTRCRLRAPGCPTCSGLSRTPLLSGVSPTSSWRKP